MQIEDNGSRSDWTLGASFMIDRSLTFDRANKV